MIPRSLMTLVITLVALPAFAHVGDHPAATFGSGAMHPLTGLDHITAMVAVGLWAALKGGRALWVWPAAFISMMLAGGVLGSMQIGLPFVEQGILASVLVFGIMVALAVDLPLAAGAAIISVFALFHGYAHGAEAPTGGVSYFAGFALTTAALHATGIGIAVALQSARLRPMVRAVGAGCIVLGAMLVLKTFALA